MRTCCGWPSSMIDRLRSFSMLAGQRTSTSARKCALISSMICRWRGATRCEQRLRPALQRLGQERVVGVREAPLRELERLLERQPVVVDEEPHELRDRERRVRVVQLDRDLVGEAVEACAGSRGSAPRCRAARRPRRSTPAGAAAPCRRWSTRAGRAPSRRARTRASARRRGGSRPGGRCRCRTRRRRARSRAAASSRCARRSSTIGRSCGSAEQHALVGPARASRGRRRRASFSTTPYTGTRSVSSRRMISQGEPLRAPAVGVLALLAVLDRLAEQAVLVVDAVAEAGHVEARERVEVAGGEPAEAAVAERGVGLELAQRLEVDAERGRASRATGSSMPRFSRLLPSERPIRNSTDR